MKTASPQPSRLIGITLLAITMGLLLLMHVTSDREERCARETVDISLLKLI